MIVVLMCVGGIFFYLSERGNPVIENAGLPISILPGSSKALLVLENGEVVPLTAEYDSVCRELKGENFVNDGKRLLYIDTLVTEEAEMAYTESSPVAESTCCVWQTEQSDFECRFENPLSGSFCGRPTFGRVRG